MNYFKTEKLKKIRLEQAENRKRLKRLIHNEKSAYKLSKNQIKLNNPNEYKFKCLLIELGIKFEYQKPYWDYERYISVDFYLPDKNIVIEIDGISHDKTLYQDTIRTIYLKKVHNVCKVVRFTNNQVANDIDSIKKKLYSKLNNK